MNAGRDFAGELFKHQVLVLGFGTKLGNLEQALAIPFVVLDAIEHVGPGQHPVGGKSGVAIGQFGTDQILGLFDQAVVLEVEHFMHGGQANVFVDAAITGDVVRVEQFVVVLQVIAPRINGNGITCDGVGIRHQHPAHDDRHRIVRNVVKEGVLGADRARRANW